MCLDPLFHGIAVRVVVANLDRAELDEASAQLLLISESVWRLVLPFTWFLGYYDIFLDTFQTLSLCFKPHLVAEYPETVLLQSHLYNFGNN